MVADGQTPPTGSTRPPLRQDAPALADAMESFNATWIGAQRYLMAQADRLKLAVRTIVVLAAIGIVALFFVIAIFVSAAVLITSGAANGVAQLMGGRVWAGDLIVGCGVVVITALVGYLMIVRLNKASRRRTMANYQTSKMSN